MIKQKYDYSKFIKSIKRRKDKSTTKYKDEVNIIKECINILTNDINIDDELLDFFDSNTIKIFEYFLDNYRSNYDEEDEYSKKIGYEINNMEKTKNLKQAIIFKPSSKIPNEMLFF